MMKKIVVFWLVLCGMCFWAHGQNKSVESAKVAFLSQKTNLTPVQAEKFWPLYNEFTDKRADIRKSIRAIYKSMAENPEISAEKVKQNISQIATLKHEDANLEKEYFNRYLLIITPKQLADLISAEREFQKILIKKVSED